MIYTIGHSKHPAERFIALLRQHDIGALADVRSTPFTLADGSRETHKLPMPAPTSRYKSWRKCARASPHC